MSRNERIVIGLVATEAWLGLSIQADISFTGMLAKGLTLSDALIRFFSYFTILTNSLIAVHGTACLLTGESRWTRSSHHTSFATGLAVSIFFVGVCYAILLRRLLHLEGSALLAAQILHDAVPVLFLLYWFRYASKHRVPWSHASLWVLYPFVYFLYALIQGWRTGLYPYPFIDATHIGYRMTLANGGILLVLFWLGGLLFIAVGRALHRPEEPSGQKGPDQFPDAAFVRGRN
jgi:hypothetical protein